MSATSKPGAITRPAQASFLYGLFGLLNFIHAADHERREIALRDLFHGRLFVAERLPSKLGPSLLRGLLKLGSYTGNCLVE